MTFPFDTKYQGVLIRTHSEFMHPSFSEMDSTQKTTGTSLSLLWVHHAERTNLIGVGGLTFNIALIVRNQSDYSNIITLMGTYSAISEHTEKTPERLLLFITENLFKRIGDYVILNDVKGKDGLCFEVPDCIYSDSSLKRQLTWKFEHYTQ